MWMGNEKENLHLNESQRKFEEGKPLERCQNIVAWRKIGSPTNKIHRWARKNVFQSENLCNRAIFPLNFPRHPESIAVTDFFLEVFLGKNKETTVKQAETVFLIKLRN